MCCCLKAAIGESEQKPQSCAYLSFGLMYREVVGVGVGIPIVQRHTSKLISLDCPNRGSVARCVSEYARRRCVELHVVLMATS